MTKLFLHLTVVWTHGAKRLTFTSTAVTVSKGDEK